MPNMMKNVQQMRTMLPVHVPILQVMYWQYTCTCYCCIHLIPVFSSADEDDVTNRTQWWEQSLHDQLQTRSTTDYSAQYITQHAIIIIIIISSSSCSSSSSVVGWAHSQTACIGPDSITSTSPWHPRDMCYERILCRQPIAVFFAFYLRELEQKLI